MSHSVPISKLGRRRGGGGFPAILNRTQLLVIGFFVLVWIGLVAILVLSPQIYAQTLRQVGGTTARSRRRF